MKLLKEKTFEYYLSNCPKMIKYLRTTTLSFVKLFKSNFSMQLKAIFRSLFLDSIKLLFCRTMNIKSLGLFAFYQILLLKFSLA